MSTLLSVLLAGCASESGSLDDADDVRVWATTASALAVYSQFHGPFSFADGQSTFADPACPATTDDGTTLEISGGCVDNDAREWIGSATVVRAANGERTITFDGYGSFDDPDLRAEQSGTVEVRLVAAAQREFDVALVREGGLTTTFYYAGHVEGDYDTATVWSGEGTVERDGLVAPTGTVHASTVDERVDDAVCSGQPVSGETTLSIGGRTAVITYDGETDCDGDQAARYSVDGEDRGMITGINCSIAPRGASPGGIALYVVAIGIALFIRARSIRSALRACRPTP